VGRDRETFTPEETAREAGVDPTLVGAAWRAPASRMRSRVPNRAGIRARIATFEIVRAGIELFGEEGDDPLLRVIGAAATRVATRW